MQPAFSRFSSRVITQSNLSTSMHQVPVCSRSLYQIQRLHIRNPASTYRVQRHKPRVQSQGRQAQPAQTDGSSDESTEAECDGDW